MQVVNSVLIHDGVSLALSDIVHVSMIERVGNDVNIYERKKAFRIAFSVVMLMSVIVAIFIYNHSSANAWIEIQIGIGLFAVSVISAILISIQANASFPIVKDKVFGVKVSYDGGSAVLFWHKNQLFSNKVVKALKEAVLKKESMDMNWFVDFNHQAIKMCRRNSIRDSIKLLIERAKNQAAYRF